MKSARILFLPLFFVLFLGLFVKFPLAGAVARKDFVSLSITLGDDAGYEDFADRLTALNFHNFTFVVMWTSDVANYWLANETRRATLQTYGSIIPELIYYQQDLPAVRVANAYNIFDIMNYWLGSYPKGFKSFIPDTFTAQYLYENFNCTYVQGYCFDQYTIDFMTERGGWQLPYYSSASHILKPSDGEGIIVFPHVTWDWIDSFTVAHHYNAHLQNLIGAGGMYEGNEAAGKAYWLELIDRSLTGCSPFGFVSIQNEWDWMLTCGLGDEVFEWFDTLLENPLYTFWTYEDVAEWFMVNYASNPVYRVFFASPHSETSVEWYWSTVKRVCRVGGVVLSYVDYTIPNADKYRTEAQTISWGAGWIDNPSNCIDTTIYNCLTVDALGGGLYRWAGVGDGVEYGGNLADFGGVGATVFWYQDPVRFGVLCIALLCIFCILIKLWKG